MSQAIDYRKLKDEWKAAGEIPAWYSTNALQFFMESYSYQGESVRSRDATIAKYLAEHAPENLPLWWEYNPYTAGKTWEEVFFNLIFTDGYAVLSTPLKANGGLPERGMPISCSGQTLSNSLASKSFINCELEQLIKNAHGCAISMEDWLAEGDVYDADGNMSHGIIPLINDYLKTTEDTNQGVRRGSTAFYVNVTHGDFWKVAALLEELSDKLNIGWIIRDDFINRVLIKDPDALARLARIIKLRVAFGKGYIAKLDTMNRNKADVFKILDMAVRGSNLCSELNLPADDEYTFSCPIINLNLTLWDELPEHIFFLLQVMQDCNVSGYLKQLESKKGFSSLFLQKIYKFTKDFRATGMGTCGFHSLLMMKRFTLDSVDAMLLNEEIFSRQRKETYEASEWLAKELGVPEGMVRAGIFRRNATTMFAPPTKSSTELARNSPSEGIGLQTAIIKIKETVGGDILRIEKAFLDLMKERGKFTQEEVNKIAQARSIKVCDWLTDHEKDVFSCAFECSMYAHLDLCAQRQVHFDQQQSINLYASSSDTEETIGEWHMYALLNDMINALYYCYSSRGASYERNECAMCQ
jgi:ribonucleoside-diphosphate reductase alpha chain